MKSFLYLQGLVIVENTKLEGCFHNICFTAEVFVIFMTPAQIVSNGNVTLLHTPTKT